MKAITIYNPHAEAIARGLKRVENRGWYSWHRGILAIHAGKGKKWWTDEYNIAASQCSWGAIVAVAWMSSCYGIDAINSRRCMPTDKEWLCTHEYATGPQCWVLDRVIRIKRPVPCTGAQGLWTVPDDIVAEVCRVIGEERLELLKVKA